MYNQIQIFMNSCYEFLSCVFRVIVLIALIIWQLPQFVVGWVLSYIINWTHCEIYQGIVFVYSTSMKGGISLGNVVIMSVDYHNDGDENLEKHEVGHAIQSLILGPLYLIVIGIPSLVWAILYGWLIKKTPNGYYKFYTEKWADKLGGVVRK